MISTAKTKYPKLLERGRIGNLYLKNRMVMAPMGTFSENRDGYPSKAQIDYYEARAKGGVGMVIIEGQYVTNKTDPWIDYITTADTDEQMKGWSLLAEAIHAHGSKMCLQLSCGLGRNAFPFDDSQMVSASEVPSFYFPDMMCRALTIEEVHGIVDSYRRAARRALVAEADAVEIHAHAGYMIDQFMTPVWNKRTDEYGGSFENRMRLITEIYQAIREEVGPDYPILTRMAAYHDFEDGRTLEESIEIVQYLEKLGLDAIDIDLGCYERKQWIVPSIYAGTACMADAAAAIRKAVNIPVLNAGNHTPETAEKGLEDGMFDFAMFGRPLIADPDLPNKIINNRTEDIRPCLFCNEICVGRLYQNRVISCAVNPQAVFEANYPLTKVEEPKRVVVIGGGPGGMEAARVAAERGHKVTLYEKSDRLGGQLIPASAPAFKQRLRAFADWEQRQLEKLGVEIVYNTEINENSFQLEFADHIVVALGATPITPPIKGIERENVVEVTKAHLQPELVKGERILIAGGGMSGCDCALELAMEGKKVTIIEMKEEIASDVLLDNRNPLMFKLEDYKVDMLTSHKINEFTEKGVKITTPAGAEILLEADTIITAFGMKPENTLAHKICDKYPTTDMVGDCDKLGQIQGAVRKGFFAGWAIQ
ncbi:FAD-dependent oxidoreductase [Bacillus sp. B15-48]|uniref:oxidoreductase n=1 Tax=Bacillus sp. B15-48 TaxID=1548601 RepID=UPI00193F0B28|nr:FAD-dependent oxidoreductase [Bacillus sp. B15-48]MBM4763180.1 NAD(P)-binding protein [Bacillus sp. B15-48]